MVFGHVTDTSLPTQPTSTGPESPESSSQKFWDGLGVLGPMLFFFGVVGLGVLFVFVGCLGQKNRLVLLFGGFLAIFGLS